MQLYNGQFIVKAPDWVYVPRWDDGGNVLPWAVELIESKRQRAEIERQQKEQLIAFLQSQGIDPNNLPID
ncbi:hypothetical protein [Gloeocapsopsis crepidinum]|uniref:hypothetical protein n=1 Tax=Gloeocapsopsis crepidinum TaxID=693223 RepID=UPI001D135A4F|nr:hypothetical protein [Gloeocapsopsis crepidinum]